MVFKVLNPELSFVDGGGWIHLIKDFLLPHALADVSNSYKRWA